MTGANAQTRRRAVVLLSGGLDSATALAIARERGFRCHALSVDYGQRHRHELAAARRVAGALGVEGHVVLPLDLRVFGGSALTSEDIDVPKAPESAGETIPATYVPARNTILLSIALGLAETIPAHHVFIGANAVDYSGYPDCRPAFIEAFERVANLGTRAGVEGRPFRIHAPLIDMTKAEIIRRGTSLGVDYSLTLSCYDPADAAGGPVACGRCDSCRIRRRGFEEAGVSDPTRYTQETPV